MFPQRQSVTPSARILVLKSTVVHSKFYFSIQRIVDKLLILLRAFYHIFIPHEA